MYFPYLRGRQFELLALQELLNNNEISKQVIPVLEPVKLSSTLSRTIALYVDQHHPLCLIMNPQVGDFAEYSKDNFLIDNADFEKTKELLRESDNIISAFIMDKGLLHRINDYRNLGQSMVINRKRDDFQSFCTLFSGDEEPKYTMVPDDRAFRRRVRKSGILLSDRFQKKPRNSDYLETEDEFFSDDHLYYDEDYSVGFSDYSVVGADYNESGFAPIAVAIHIVYFDTDWSLRIHHFVSDSNIDINNPAGKYGEAVNKLVHWMDSHNSKDPFYIETQGLREFRQSLESGRYPGLGTVKKYSIMHHLELMSYYLERNPAHEDRD